MHTFEELIANKVPGYSPGFDLVTRERYMAKTENGGNHNYDSLSIRTLESNLTAYSANVSHTMNITFGALPSVTFCSAGYFKGKKLKDGNGNRIPVAHVPTGTYALIGDRIYSIDVQEKEYCGSILIKDPENPIPEIVVATPGIRLFEPDRDLRKKHRKYLKAGIQMSSVHDLLDNFDIDVVYDSVRKYIPNYSIVIPKGETLESFLDSPLMHAFHSNRSDEFGKRYDTKVRQKYPRAQSWWSIGYDIRSFIRQVGREVLPYHVDELYIDTGE